MPRAYIFTILESGTYCQTPLQKGLPIQSPSITTVYKSTNPLASFPTPSLVNIFFLSCSEHDYLHSFSNSAIELFPSDELTGFPFAAFPLFSLGFVLLFPLFISLSHGKFSFLVTFPFRTESRLQGVGSFRVS